MIRITAVALALVAGIGAGEAAARPFTPGLVATADHKRAAAAAARLGARVVRVEFDIGTRPRALRRSVRRLARRGTRALLLAGFHGRMPTEAEAANLGRWAAEFGAGGRFWARWKRPLPVRQIEFGNETSYSVQYGDTWSDASYSARARLYAIRFRQAHAAVEGRVGLLAQADDGGSASPAWVDGMYAAVPRLHRLVDGWTVHPYGPRERWEPKLRRLIGQTKAHGAPRRIPIDVTEYGVTSDDGAHLTDNYGWPANITYQGAAAALRSTVAGMRGARGIGRRLRLFILYSAHDLRAHRRSHDREHYFGALRHNLRPKGAYSAEVRRVLGR